MNSSTATAIQPEIDFIDCPVCSSNSSRVWGAENGYRAVKCEECGVVYVNPRPSKNEISEANKIGEHRTASGTLNVLYNRSQRKVRHYHAIIGKLFADELRVKKPVSWLDVGAGYGELLEALKRILPRGSVLDGIEPMQDKVMEARRVGLNVLDTPLDAVTLRYDIVSLINVVSHLPDVEGFLRQIRQVLNSDGLLLIETGNGGDLLSAEEYPDLLHLPDHLIFLGIDHIKLLVERAGFEVLAVHEARRDTASWMLKNVVKRLLGRNVMLGIPYRSPFRTVFFKARVRA